MSVETNEFQIVPMDDQAYIAPYNNFVCSKYTAEEIEALLDRLSKKKYVVDTNCPNCGAPITKSQCEYCGTVFTDLAEQEKKIKQLREEQARLQIQASNAVNLASLIHEQQTYQSNLRSILYADNVPCAVGYSGGTGGSGSFSDGSVQILYY